jgi:hypothetical protein
MVVLIESRQDEFHSKNGIAVGIPTVESVNVPFFLLHRWLPRSALSLIQLYLGSQSQSDRSIYSSLKDFIKEVMGRHRKAI